MKSVLITGIAGSAGSYLAEHILENFPGVAVHGIARWHSTSSHGNLKKIANKITVHECDLCDFGSIVTALQSSQPDHIYHVAAYANVRASFKTPLAVIQNNVMGTANLLEAVRLHGTKPRFELCSTSEVYGQVEKRFIPITEETPINPCNPYAVSKLTQDALGYTYFKAYDIPIVRTRAFGYLNPRRPDLFATAFALQIAKIEAGLQQELVHGNLDSIRTLLDVRDVADAYVVALDKGAPGEIYNIGATVPFKIGEFLEILKKHAKVKINSRVDPALLRPTDVTDQVPCVDKFARVTGWKPKYELEESVRYLLECCREMVRG